MGMTIEFYDAAYTVAEALPPGTEVPEDGEDVTEGWALAFSGDSAAVIDGGAAPGSRARLFALLDAARAHLQEYCTAEHQNGLHAEPEPGCPLCPQPEHTHPLWPGTNLRLPVTHTHDGLPTHTHPGEK